MSQQQTNKTGANPDVNSTDDDEDGLPPRTSLVGFVAPVVLVAALGGAGLYFYRQSVLVEQEVGEILVKARDKVKKHDLASLKEAEESYKIVLEKKKNDPRALSYLALAYFHQSEHGLATLDLAEQNVRRAKEEGATTPVIYAADAYLKIARGSAVEAERELRALIEKEIGGSEMAHALGWAAAEQGRYIEGNRIIRQASEGDFSAMAYSVTLAEIAHRQGEERAAVRHLQNVIRDNQSPRHQLARAWAAALQAKNYGNLVPALQALQEVEKAGDAGPRAKMMFTWAQGEIALAAGNPALALEKAQEALGIAADWAPLLDLAARAQMMAGKSDDALATLEKAANARPEYRGVRWALAKLKSERKDDSALALLADLEKSVQGTKGPEYEIFRGDHYLRTGKIEEAKAAYERAADLGDDPVILLGLAKVTFEEEKGKGKKADIERVAEAIMQATERRAVFPDAQVFLAEVSLWNFMVDPAHEAYGQAEAQYKKLNRPVPEMLRFYDQTIAAFKGVSEAQIKKASAERASEWEKKKQEFIASARGG